ncbi:sugar transferase [Allopusillimonas soli]|nr:sugar transferase [Allopusillimonas soli]TEA74087.1 sugar transferase [Allopusillimonas soli]
MIKRLFDVLMASVLLVILSPVMAIVAVCIRCSIGSPILFMQVRPGKDSRPFKMVKFRTMRICHDRNGQLLPDDERMTSVGEMLRAASLDELPELWNVLKGEMSLVGPRPLLMEYLPLYDAAQARRHEVRPGITGWAQVNGRNALGWEDKFRLDVWYVDNRSMWLDLKICVMTVIKVISRCEVNQPGQATMSRFTGKSS